MDKPAEKPLTKNELLKADKPDLSGTIRETLANPAADRFSGDDEQFIKFHGIYQQDDRDKRKTGKVFSVMVRTRQTGGIVPAAQYLVYDDLSGRFANGTLRITSRQTFQFHGVVQQGVGPLIKSINEALSSTLATCGDVNRNVTAPSNPPVDAVTQAVEDDAFTLTKALLPRTTAYHSIWVDGVQIDLGLGDKIAKAKAAADQANPYLPPPADLDDSGAAVDNLYGKTYLPRKFKTGFAIPPNNDVDIFTNDMGFVAVIEGGRLVGYNLLVGGGLGTTHGNKATYPRLADVIGFLTREQVVAVGEAVIKIHRDWGDRTDRKHARIKYVLQEKGVEWFRAELAKHLGAPLPAAKAFIFKGQGDAFGWTKQADGKWFLGLFVETGRVKDAGDYRLKTALRVIAEKFAPTFRLTATQNLILSDVKESDKAALEQLLRDHGCASVFNPGLVKGRGMACPALPTCGLSLAESERVFPALLDRLEQAQAVAGFGGEELVVRMTGCPNGCARPYNAEIGFVGKAPGKYNVMLGGNREGTRLARLYRESVAYDEIPNVLGGLFQQYAKERRAGQAFGDWADAAPIWPAAAPLA
ncbi:MAG: sulfite reductase hemoprotein beta-component [Verrucomicrobiota bacterium]|jgi:sulfite reductase (NADPH) hemoprotein beta-component